MNHMHSPISGRRARLWLAAAGLTLLLATGCRRGAPADPAPATPAADAPASAERQATPAAPAATAQPPATPTLLPPVPQPTAQTSVTFQQGDGNRVAGGRGQLPATPPRDVALDGVPAWVLAAPVGDGAAWAVVLADGRTQAWQVDGEGIRPIPVTPATLDPAFPPRLTVTGDRLHLSLHADAVPPSVTDPLPDALVLHDGSGSALLLTAPTTRYAHGVLGDAVEAAAVTHVDADGRARPVVTIPAPRVVEGLSPIWHDWDGDRRREIVLTLSDSDGGAQIVLLDGDGQRLATGPAIGRGGRWRHQLAVAPFAPDGVPELVDVLTPHIGGVVEFFRWEGDRLEIVAALPGYTSHVIGSRNLDMAAAADFDGDGRLELLLPRQDLRELGAVARSADGAFVAWGLPLPDRLSSNIATVTAADGTLAVGVGLANGMLRIWQE